MLSKKTCTDRIAKSRKFKAKVCFAGRKLLLILVLQFLFYSLNSFAQPRQNGGQEYGWYVIDPASIPGTPDFSDVYFVDDNEGWITSFSHSEIYHTTDGGETFEVQTTQFSTNAIWMLNENEGYAGGQSGIVYRTTDGGINWIAIGGIGVTLADITFPPTADTGYACGLNGNIYSVTASGVTRMTSGVPDSFRSLSFPVNSEEGWVCGGSIILHYTGGAWIADQIRPSGGYNAIYMVDNLSGWSVGDNGIIINTTDGINWFEQTNPGSSSLFDVFFLNENEGWATGLNGIIIHTTNGGTDWSVEAVGFTTEFLSGVHFTSSTNGYLVGTGKTLLKFGEITSVEKEEELPTEFSLSQNYPNPFNPTTKIKFRIPRGFAASPFAKGGTQGGFVSLIVYDVLGNEVATLVNEELSAGEYEIDFYPASSIKNPATGVYFYQLRAGSFIQTKKMLLLK